jgi:heat shock protein HslJ
VTAALRMGLVLSLVFAAGACDDAPAGPSPAIEGTWRLISLQRAGSAPVQVADPTRYTVRFDEDGGVGVRSDCNSCGGLYELAGSTLAVHDVACTLVACAPPTLDPEFVAALEAARAVTVEDGESVIEGGGWTLRFVR